MTEVTYEIVFRGDIAIGQALEQVKGRMAQLFKLAPTQVDKLFTGKAVILKKNLSKEQAEQYQKAFAKTGALVTVKQSAREGQSPVSKSEKGLTLAPAGAPLLSRRDSSVAEATAPNVDHISLRPSGGNLLDSAELPSVPAETVTVVEWGLAELGAVIDSITEEVLPLPILEADWDLAEVGAQLSLSKGEATPKVVAPELDVAPAGSDLVEPAPVVPMPEPDTDHIHLLEE